MDFGVTDKLGGHYLAQQVIAKVESFIAANQVPGRICPDLCIIVRIVVCQWRI